MELTLETTRLTLVQGDITQQEVDAVVNAANSSLLGGGGVDGAIHRVGGPAILEACKAIRDAQGPCPPGEAVITTAGKLPAQQVIHTVGPIWKGGHEGEMVVLERAYHNSLALAQKHGQRTVAFPSISTGAYRFPTDRAALVALGTMVRFVRESPDAFDELRMVLFSKADMETYTTTLDELKRTMLG
ncbi:MAG: O-acetyl-ADP-ribose deacetylase [Myxococcota bacterium]